MTDSTPARNFSATRWSVVLAAADHADSALAALCRAYWFPLYAFLRRQGVTPEDAEDLLRAIHSRERTFPQQVCKKNPASKRQTEESQAERSAREQERRLPPAAFLRCSPVPLIRDVVLQRGREGMCGSGLLRRCMRRAL